MNEEGPNEKASLAYYRATVATSVVRSIYRRGDVGKGFPLTCDEQQTVQPFGCWTFFGTCKWLSSTRNIFLVLKPPRAMQKQIVEDCEMDGTPNKTNLKLLAIRNCKEDHLCMFCQEFGSDNELWFCCALCLQWAHAECTDFDTVEGYMCFVQQHNSDFLYLICTIQQLKWILQRIVTDSSITSCSKASFTSNKLFYTLIENKQHLSKQRMFSLPQYKNYDGLAKFLWINLRKNLRFLAAKSDYRLGHYWFIFFAQDEFCKKIFLKVIVAQ
ncbi:hypothetical protein NQ317_003029 [Molorchus minor]|uniref:Uncharacterized protein n=1 Tax=Molorchus minor TaxID=1323400 RepID=A0ABQ9JIL0_9CUCU|nr:hypothetical protein NQ317_003029 [Molorchus minor]